jgi:uncharacterized protein YcfJ
LCLATAGWAAEYGTVVSSTPLVMAVPIPQRLCSDEPVSYQQPPSGAGALIGAIAGAAIGNSIGSGSGRAAATGIGLIAGSAIGNRAEAEGAPVVDATVQRCRTVTRYENRTVAYDVVYDYQGVRRSVRLAQDPGERIALEVNVVPAGAAAIERPADPVYAQPEVIYEQPAPQVVYTQPAYTAGYPAYLNPWPYFAVGISLGRHGGGHRGGYGHGWRR